MPQGQTIEAAACAFCRGRSDWDFLREFFQRVEPLNAHAMKIKSQLQQSISNQELHRSALAACDFSLGQTRALLDEERRNARVHQGAVRADLENRDRQHAAARTELEEVLEMEECDNAALRTENAGLKCRLDLFHQEQETLHRELQIEQQNHRRTKIQFDESYQRALLHLDMFDQRDARVKELETSVGVLTQRAAVSQEQLEAALQQVAVLQGQPDKPARRAARGGVVSRASQRRAGGSTASRVKAERDGSS